MYDPVIGRWMSVDPARQYASGYVGMGNNPVMGVDPDGRYSYFGALWRNVARGGHGLVEEGSNGGWSYIERGYNSYGEYGYDFRDHDILSDYGSSGDLNFYNSFYLGAQSNKWEGRVVSYMSDLQKPFKFFNNVTKHIYHLMQN